MKPEKAQAISFELAGHIAGYAGLRLSGRGAFGFSFYYYYYFVGASGRLLHVGCSP
jgi:hypothetical protein